MAFAEVPTYPLFLLLAVVAGAACWAVLLRREGVGPARTLVLLATAGAAALAGAKAYSWAERGGLVWWDPAWELVHGYRYPGGILGLAVVALLLRRLLPSHVSLLRAADALAPTVALSMVVVRLGCFLAGCCHGVASELPWAVRFARDSPAWHAHLERGWIERTATSSAAVHPLQLYFALSSLVLAVVLLCGARQRCDGETFCLFLIADGVLKMLLEQLRLDHRASLAWAAAAFAVAGVAGAARLSGRPRRLVP